MISPHDIGQPSPDIFQYLSLEDFLKDFLEAKRASNHRMTMGSLAMAMGFKSRASFHHYLTGQRSPKGEHLKLFLEYFDFSEAEKNHFLNLIELKNIDDLAFESTQLLKNKLRRDRPGFKLIDSKILNVAHHWLHYAVKEVLNSYKKIKDLKELKSLFLFHKKGLPLGVIIDDLFSLGHIAYDKEGFLVSVVKKQKTTEQGSSHNIQKYHREVLELGKTAIHEVPVDERYFSSVTFSGDEEKFNRLVNFIKELEKECTVNKEDSNVKRVYQCNMQIFPVAGKKELPH